MTENSKLQGRMDRLSWLLDSSIRLPGGYRVGVDSVIGLVPGVGDVASAAMAFYIIYLAARSGASWWSIFRMFINVVTETIIGIIPIAGDVFDAVFKANVRNVAILEQQIAAEGRQDRSHLALMMAVILSIVAVFVLMVAGLIWLLIWLF